MANYLMVWIRNYSEQSGILANLLKKGKCVRNDWGAEQTAAFLALKAAFKVIRIKGCRILENSFIWSRTRATTPSEGPCVRCMSGRALKPLCQ